MQSEEWTHMAHDQVVKKRIEDLVHTAYHPKPKPKVQKVELSADAKAKIKAKSQQKAKKPAGKPKK